jgi:hypothetical protein
MSAGLRPDNPSTVLQPLPLVNGPLGTSPSALITDHSRVDKRLDALPNEI